MGKESKNKSGFNVVYVYLIQSTVYLKPTQHGKSALLHIYIYISNMANLWYFTVTKCTQIFTNTNKDHIYILNKQKKPTRRIHLTLIRRAIIKKITPPRPGTPRAPGTVAWSWPGEDQAWVCPTPLVASLSPGLGGSHQEGWQGGGSVHHQQGAHQKIHYQLSPELPRRGFREARPLGIQRNPEICHEGDRSSRCVGWHQAQQSCWAKGTRSVPCCVRLSESIRKTQHPSSVWWLPMYLSPSSKIYRWLLWMKTIQ